MTSTSYHYGRMDAQFHLSQHPTVKPAVMALTARYQAAVIGNPEKRAYWLGVAREARK